MRRLPDYLWCSQDSLAACLLRTYAFARKASAGRLGFSERTWTDFDPVGGELSSLAPLGVGPPWLTHVRDRVHASTGCVVRVNELANEIGTHPVYLARVFRRYFGSSPTAYLHRVRVTQAAHRIATSADSLCRIAADLGFADQAHLCRRFRSHIGLTPNAFRHLTHPL